MLQLLEVKSWESLTYDNLNCAANKIANFLQEKSIEKEMVCISSKNSLTISCIIMFKTGAVYVILDRRVLKSV